jgi:cell surface protein SprA
LFKDVKIDLSLSRSYSENFTEEYEITNRKYSALSPTSYGAFSVSTALIKTSFLKSDVNSSTAFNDFRNNRIIIARRLAANNKYYTGDFDTDGYPSGYGSTNQAVLLPAFLAAYTGTDASNVSLGMFRNFPIPNWNIKYSGLMNYDFFKSNFKKFSLQHNYSASYAISSFTSNSDYDSDPDGTDSNDNFYNEYSLSSITLVEQFSPLLKMDVELKNTLKVLAEIKKNRSLTLSFDNELMTEVSAMEYIVGLGFRIKDVTFSSKLADNPTGVIKSDVVLKADVSYKKSQTIVRYLDYDDNELTAGKDVWSLKLTADYSLSKNLTATFYYNHSFSDAVVSTSYPLTSISSGFTILYSFGN